MRLVNPTFAARERHVLKALEHCEAKTGAATSGHHSGQGAHVILDTDHRTEPVLRAKADVGAHKRACRATDRHAKRGVSLVIMVEEEEVN